MVGLDFQQHGIRFTAKPGHARGLIALVMLVLPISCVGQDSSLRMLAEDREALQVRVDLIEQAEQTIDLAYYAIDTDEVPIALLELLRQASLRGVRVRMLADGLKSRLPSKFEKYLRRWGIQVRVYHPPHQLNPRWLNRRLHSKLMVVDANAAVIGSRNLENGHYAFDEGRNFVDCDAFVAGEVARHAQAYFDWLWETPDVRRAPQRDSFGLDVLNYRPYGRTEWKKAWREADGPSDYQRLLDRALRRIVCRSGIQLDSKHDWVTDAAGGMELRLLYDGSSDKSEHRVRHTIVRMMDQAKGRLLIESPYPAFDRAIRSAISRARSRGVCVTILTNSLDSTDQLSVYAAYQNQKRSLLLEGVHLYEYCGKDTLHAKTMIVDGTSWMLGSYNFDARSNHLNLELCIVSNDPVGADRVGASVQTRLARSKPLARGQLILPVGKETSRTKRARLPVKRTFVELYRGFL